MSDERGSPKEPPSNPIERDKLLSEKAKTLITTSMASLAILYHFFAQGDAPADVQANMEIGLGWRWCLAGAFGCFGCCVLSALFGQGYLTEEGDYPHRSLPPGTHIAYAIAYMSFSFGIVLATAFFIGSLF